MSIVQSLVLIMAIAGVTLAAQTTPLDDAIRLQREGRNREAQHALRALLPELRASNDRTALVRALAAATDASIALGDYESAIQDAQEAYDLHQRLGQRADAAWDLNAAGLANLYLGRYDRALASYQRALALDRATGDGDGEATRLNNIGNVYYMRGHYADALRSYQEALTVVDARTSERARARLRKMTISNQAALHQRLGADERALDLYGRLRSGETMQPSEEAQLLINQGALLRRLGDPIKAMQTYRQAQALFARGGHRDGEIGAWRNIGIAYAMDLHDNQQALDAFDAALKLAQASSSQRGEIQARLYRGETLRRMGRLADAASELRDALGRATDVGLVEEQWKAVYSLGRVAGAEGRRDEARRSYEQAIAIIESVRSDLQTVTLKSEFLADKRDVYDALIALRIADSPASAADVFALVEQSRARAWQDRLQPGAERLSLADVQPRIPHGTILLEYWSGADALALLWISSSASGIVQLPSTAADVASLNRFVAAVSRVDGDWRTGSVAAGRVLFSGLRDTIVSKDVTRLIVVADGPLHFIPFEALTIPDGRDLLLERFEITYLPSAAWLVRRSAQPRRAWTWPWQRLLVAFGDPSTSLRASPATSPSSDEDAAMPGSPARQPRWGGVPRLAHAEEEIREIVGTLPGRADVHVGSDAQKKFLYHQPARAPLLHFSTHAIADTRDPDRSRVLLAPPAAGGPADSLFLREIYDLDLAGVQLVTLSACDTERGKVIRGEGVEGFSRALLAAGAASAVTTMWDVVDRASAEFMKQFYFGLSRGEPEASALREAKLQFLRSSLAWSHPRYWAGYVLNGDGAARLPRVIPWSLVVAAAAIGALFILALLRRT